MAATKASRRKHAALSATGKAVLAFGKCKPSKAASTDPTRPKLMTAAVIDHDGKRVLLTTNSYMLAAIPVADDIPKIAVSPEALKRIEAGETHEIIDSGAVKFIGNLGNVTVDQPSAGMPFDHMPVEFDPGTTTVSIGLNPQLLADLAQALGAKNQGVRLTINVNDEFSTMRAIKVEPLSGGNNRGQWGLLMPVRLNV